MFEVEYNILWSIQIHLCVCAPLYMLPDFRLEHIRMFILSLEVHATQTLRFPFLILKQFLKHALIT